MVGTLELLVTSVKKDPLEAALEKVGVRLEKREDVNPLTQMIASGMGGIAGQVVGGSILKLGGVGRAVVSLMGAVAGHVAVTYRIRFEKPKTEEGHVDRPESPMVVSDRR